MPWNSETCSVLRCFAACPRLGQDSPLPLAQMGGWQCDGSVFLGNKQICVWWNMKQAPACLTWKEDLTIQGQSAWKYSGVLPAALLKTTGFSAQWEHIWNEMKWDRSRFLGRGCDEALFSEKKGVLSEKGGGNSVNQGFGKDFYRKGNSVKSSGRFSEPPDSENWTVAVLIPFPKISSYEREREITEATTCFML